MSLPEQPPLVLDIGVPSGRITDILNGRRALTADTAVRIGRYFGNSAQFWLDLQGQYHIAVVEREEGGGNCATRAAGRCGVRFSVYSPAWNEAECGQRGSAEVPRCHLS